MSREIDQVTFDKITGIYSQFEYVYHEEYLKELTLKQGTGEIDKDKLWNDDEFKKMNVNLLNSKQEFEKTYDNLKNSRDIKCIADMIKHLDNLTKILNEMIKISEKKSAEKMKKFLIKYELKFDEILNELKKYE